MSRDGFKTGETFETKGFHALNGVEMISTDPTILDRYVSNVAGDIDVCRGCHGTLIDVQNCLSGARGVSTQNGPTAISAQCAASAMKRLTGIMEEED